MAVVTGYLKVTWSHTKRHTESHMPRCCIKCFSIHNKNLLLVVIMNRDDNFQYSKVMHFSKQHSMKNIVDNLTLDQIRSSIHGAKITPIYVLCEAHRRQRTFSSVHYAAVYTHRTLKHAVLTHDYEISQYRMRWILCFLSLCGSSS